jgi:hypothetical protein
VKVVVGEFSEYLRTAACHVLCLEIDASEFYDEVELKGG